MYKVFIQNKPLFFVNVEKIQSLDGIFIRQSLANTNKEYVLSLLNNSLKNVPIMLFSDKPEEGISTFFEDFDFVEAAGGIVRRKEKYLFIKRNGIWDIPKGKMEEGESPEESAIREIEEECGIFCEKVEELITITYHTYVYDGKPTIKKTYWYALNFDGKKKLSAQKEEGITKAKWLKKDKVMELREETFPSIVDVIDYYFAD
ncbi:MAG: NUDIX hydrolase [Flavobacteriia bacterium]|jgi:8-oxo-dGTP pyrophosphatase MutT (NUDIX family)